MRYKGAVISATPPTTSTTTATGVWTLPQQMQAQGAGNWPTPFVGYIEDVFSTYLYTGNSSNRSITNGIDLSTKGGMVWFKSRNVGSNNYQVDTARGNTKYLSSNFTVAQLTFTDALTAFNTTGFNLGVDAAAGDINGTGIEMCSWTFRKQPKFFDIVTYTGTGANRTISHNLGSVPGCIFVKRTDTSADWAVYHTSLANTEYLVLNSAAAKATGATWWNSTTPTSSVFSVGTDASVNASGGTYVAYLFAHNAGGFGLTGADNVITCGGFTTSSYYATVNLGYEPQFVLTKRTDSSTDGGWYMADTMRGLTANANATFATLFSNTSDAESQNGNIQLTSTGFVFGGAATGTYIYIAIRRGPMKVPTVGTSVFSPIVATGSSGTKLTTNFAVDSQITAIRIGSGVNSVVNDRLRGVSTSSAVGTPYLVTTTTAAESSSFITTQFWDNTGFQIPGIYGGPNSIIYWNFQRAPGFFDVVCYTGNGTSQNIAHNLTVAPQLIIVKRRDTTSAGRVYSATIGNTKTLVLFSGSGDSQAITDTGVEWGATTPTSSVFSVGAAAATNGSGYTYVAYLFATCPGVSKVGSYTGTGATQTIDCGFTGGARFVLIKRTDTTGDWYVWDTARGMVSGTDPSLLLNTTAAEVNANSVYTTGVGFQIVSTAAGINASGGTYIFLAVA
jgi:hypothetical protein